MNGGLPGFLLSALTLLFAGGSGWAQTAPDPPAECPKPPQMTYDEDEPALPVPSGLLPYAWYFFSIFVGVIVGLILEPLPGAAIAVIGITVATVLGRFVLFSPQQLAEGGFRPASAALTWALSGYSNSTVWLIFGAFILALGYDKTGLGHRLALVIIKRMGKSTLLLGCGITLADTILAPFIPSLGVRSGGIIYPIANDLALDYGSKPNDRRRVGSGPI